MTSTTTNPDQFNQQAHESSRRSNKRRLVSAWAHEMSAARAARQSCDDNRIWRHLERAHILSQPLAGRHVRTHLAMLSFAWREQSLRELAGQLVRVVVAAPGSWTRRYPAGNTGGADVSAFAVMHTPDDLQAVLQFFHSRLGRVPSPKKISTAHVGSETGHHPVSHVRMAADSGSD